MHEILNFLLVVSIILVIAKASGALSIRLGQPSVLGELLAGLVLGPTVINLLGIIPSFAEDTHLAASITLFAEIGVLLLMFLAGLELEIGELLRSGRVSAVAGTLGVIVPLIGGYLTARAFGVQSTEALFIGLALSATSVSISAQTLMELGVLRSKVGLALLGAAVFDDILVVLLLAGAWIAYDRFKVLFDPTAPAIASGIVYVVMLMTARVAAERERRRLALALEAQRRAAARLEGELSAARAIQLGILPRVFPAFPERRDFDVHAMLERGVYLPPSAYEAWFLSAAHDQAALDVVLAALPAAAAAAAQAQEAS